MKLMSLVGTAVLAAVCTASPVQAQSNIVLTSIDLKEIKFNAATGVLTTKGGTVTGLFRGLPFTTVVEEFTLRPAQGNGRRCSVLHLELGPIEIALLGLFVDTSPICLDITAFRDRGILGNLLCGLTGDNLGRLTSADMLSGLSDILNTAMGRAKGGNGNGGNGNGGGVEDICTGECEVLDLVLGPLTLNLLGVQVKLDDCTGGPVQVCISATAGEGLLGDLLCGLTGDLDLAKLLAALDKLGLLDDVNVLDLVALIKDLLPGLPVG